MVTDLHIIYDRPHCRYQDFLPDATLIYEDNGRRVLHCVNHTAFAGMLHELATESPFIAMAVLSVATMNIQPIYEPLKERRGIANNGPHHNATLDTTCELSDRMSLRWCRGGLELNNVSLIPKADQHG